MTPRLTLTVDQAPRPDGRFACELRHAETILVAGSVLQPGDAFVWGAAEMRDWDERRRRGGSLGKEAA